VAGPVVATTSHLTSSKELPDVPASSRSVAAEKRARRPLVTGKRDNGAYRVVMTYATQSLGGAVTVRLFDLTTP